MKEYTLNDIIDTIKDDIVKIEGGINDIIKIKGIKPAYLPEEDSLDWIGSRKADKQLIAEKIKAKVIVCDTSVKFSSVIKVQHKVLLYVENPKLAIAKIGNALFTPQKPASIHPSAVIDDVAKIGKNTYIGSNCTIGKCTIGDCAIIHAGVTIYDDVRIGKNILIHSGAVVGTDGLGCERKSDGELIKFPHLGKLVIGDNVEIGANSIVAKGALSDTKIGNGTKINGLCFIAHNVVIGKNVLVTGRVMIAGSAEIKDNVLISPGAVIREQVIIGKGAHVGLGAVVTKNIPEGETWIGVPAGKMLKSKIEQGNETGY